MNLCFSNQLDWQNESRHRSDSRMTEGCSQPFQPTSIQKSIIIGVRHDFRGGIPGTSVASYVQSWPVLPPEYSHSLGKICIFHAPFYRYGDWDMLTPSWSPQLGKESSIGFTISGVSRLDLSFAPGTTLRKVAEW